MNLYRWPRVARTVERLADWLNGPTCDVPGAFTWGGMSVYLSEQPPSVHRHEWIHVLQAERYCPLRWRWLPGIRLRAWFGWKRFLAAYTIEHIRRGYEYNAFEIEARMAEIEP